MAPTISEGEIKFRIYGKDHTDWSHAHIFIAGVEVAQVNLKTEELDYDQMSRGQRKRVLSAFRKHRNELLVIWNELHPRQ